MTQAAKMGWLLKPGYLGYSPRHLFEVMLGVPEHEVLHTLQKGLRA